MQEDRSGLACLVVNLVGILGLLAAAVWITPWWVPWAALAGAVCLNGGINYAIEVYDNSKEK